MSQSKSKIPSPSRSQGAPITPRQLRTRRTLSVASPARSDASGRLTNVVEQYLKDDKFTVSPMRRRSVLPDDTDIEMPRRASWWKRLECSSRDVLEALDTNQMQGDLLEEYEFEVPQEKQTVQTLPENSDNDSVASIVVPHRKLFNQKKPPQEKFAEIAGSRKSLGKTLLDDQDQTIKELPKNLFSKGQPRNKPVFPAALLNSTNKTMNKTVEPEPNTQGRNLFGQGGTKRKNMFTDFVLSDSEDDSLVQHKVFGFKNKRVSLASRNRRMPSLTPSVTTDIDIDDWNLLPSSTMIGNGSGAMEESRIVANEEIEQAQTEDQDVTLTEANESLEQEAGRLDTSNKSRKSKSLNKSRLSKSRKLDDFDKTLTNEDIEAQPSENKQTENIEELHEANKSRTHNKTVVSEFCKNNTMEIETSKQEKSGKEQTLQQDQNDININEQSTENEPSIEETMAEIHKEREDKSEQIEASVEQESEKEISHEDKDEDMEEPESSKEISDNQEEDTIEPENSKEISENQEEDITEPEVSKEITNDDPDDTEKSESSKEITNENQEEIEQDDTKEAESSKEINNDNQDEEMEPMVWSDNDAEKASVSNENDAQDEEENVENSEQEENDNKQEVSDHATPVKEIQNKSQKVVESSAKEDEGEEQEDDVVDDTPNSSSTTTGHNRKKTEIEVNSPETVLKNISKDDMSFKPMGRSTSFRKSKSAIEDINLRPTLIPIQESTIGSEGSRNSGTGGSGWDSHRTTRQTLRQTFGKDFTPRKSLRALVMEQSAKRQMADANASKANKTNNKTVEDVADHKLRDRRVPNRNLSSDQLPDPKSPVPDNSTRHEINPLISKPQVSYHKSLHDINEHHISHQTISIEKSVNNNQATIDSGPEISIDASYGQGMSREEFEQEHDQTADKTKHHEKSRHKITAKKDAVPIETEEIMQEELDYDPSIQDSVHEASEAEISVHEKSVELSEKENSENEHSVQELSDHDDEEEKEDTEQEVEAEESEQEDEQEQELEEESQQNIEPESENELEHEESQQIEVESEQDEDVEMSQQEIESEDEQQQEVELDSERESENEQNESQESVHDVSQQESEQESDHDISDVPQIEINSDNEQNDQTSEVVTERVVFDNEMSDQEIDYEVSDRVSRQITEDEVTEQLSDMETDREISVSRFSEQANDLDESIGTKKSLLLMQMQRIAQQNMEIKMKIREQVKNSLKPTNNNMPISKFPIRRVTKADPKKPKTQLRQTTLAFGALPKEFVEDLKYKPPKRYQPATASWITKRLYKFLETKLEPKYDYRARVRAEELVQTIHSFTKLVRRRDLAPQNAVDELKKEMARLNVVKTHFEFYEFFHDFMPREVRVKVNPDVVNRIPMPRNGIFGDILQSRTDAA